MTTPAHRIGHHNIRGQPASEKCKARALTKAQQRPLQALRTWRSLSWRFGESVSSWSLLGFSQVAFLVMTKPPKPRPHKQKGNCSANLDGDLASDRGPPGPKLWAPRWGSFYPQRKKKCNRMAPPPAPPAPASSTGVGGGTVAYQKFLPWAEFMFPPPHRTALTVTKNPP